MPQLVPVAKCSLMRLKGAILSESVCSEGSHLQQRKAGIRGYLTLFHLPTTTGLLSLVVISSTTSPVMDLNRLAFFLLESFLLIGVAANYLDEIRGRPWNTTIQICVLWVVGIGALIASSLIGLYLALEIGLWFLPLIVAWAFLTASYSLELFNGKLHNALTLGSLMFLASLGAATINGVKPTWVSIEVAFLSAFIAGYGRQQYEVGKPAGRDNKSLPSSQRIWWWLMLEIVFIDAVAVLSLAARIW